MAYCFYDDEAHYNGTSKRRLYVFETEQAAIQKIEEWDMHSATEILLLAEFETSRFSPADERYYFNEHGEEIKPAFKKGRGFEREVPFAEALEN